MPASGMAAVSRLRLPGPGRGLARRPGGVGHKKFIPGHRVEHKQRTTTRKFLFRPLSVNSKQGQYKDREQRKQRRTTDRTPTVLVGTTAYLRCVGRAKPSEATRVSDSQ